MFIELVNTLTQDANVTAATNGTLISDATAGTGAKGGIDLSGWDMVITDDTVTGRPDPYTGQVPLLATGNAYTTTPLVWQLSMFTNPILALQASPTTTVLPDGRVSGTSTYYYVLSNPAGPAGSE